MYAVTRSLISASISLTASFTSHPSIAQKSNPINYLEQTLQGHDAQLFAPGIVSTDAMQHSSPAFSPDGKTVLWSVMKMPSYQTYLVEMRRINNKWSPAHTPSFSDTTANEVYPSFSASGDTLYFSSDRQIPAASSKINTLWYVVKTNNGWSEAKLLDTITFRKDVYAHSVAVNGNWYFTVGHGSSNWNIFKRDNSGKVDPMPPSINSSGYEDGPFIAPDESYLIFESDRPTNTEGNIDLYISFRKKDDTWTHPINMGPEINTTAAERFAKVSPDGKYLFFGRNTGKGFDIYWIDANIISDLRREYIPLEKAG